MFNVKINKSTPVVTERELLASGASRVYDVKFEFDEEWDGLVKSAIFKAGEKSVGVLLEGDTCEIPWEVLVNENIGESLWVGVYGESADGVTLPTVWDMLEVIQQGTELADAGEEPTPGIVAQIYEAARNAEDEAVKASENAAEAAEKAAGAETHATAAKLSADAAEISEKKAAEYAISAADSASSAKNSYSNAVKDTAIGSAVTAVDVSPIEHDLAVRVKSKNLINNTLSSQEINGLTVTVNEDKSVTVNGTATAKTYLSICELPQLSTDKTYFLSGGMEGNSSATACLYIFSSTLSDGTREYYYDTGGAGKALKFTEGLTYTVRVLVNAGFTCDNLTFYPQLEEGTAATEYMPYADVEGTAVKQYGKNLLPYPYAETTKTVGDVTLTDNGDGSITVDGSTGDTNLTAFYLVRNFTLPVGTYSISGGYNGDTSQVQVIVRKNGKSWLSTVSKSLQVGTVEKGDTIDYFAIYLPKNQTYNNVRIYPQLEVGDTPTEYEPYIEPVTAAADADGNVTGLVSVSPNMTLIPEASGAVVECTYNRDLMKVIDELTQAIISLGGNL